MIETEVEKINIHDPLFRQALWEAHSKRCAYSGEPIRFSDLQVEHIIPQKQFEQPEKLKALLESIGLPEDFNMDQPENLLPTSGFSNRQKSDHIDLLQLRHALNTARSKLPVLEKIYRRIRSDDEIGIARLRIMHGVATGEISTGDVIGLLNEVRTGNVTGLLKRPLVFADQEVVDISTVSDPCTLLDNAMCPRIGGLPHLTLINDADRELAVTDCRGWLEGLSRGYYAKTNYDIKESAFFKAIVSLVWALKLRKPPLETYLLGGLMSTERLPPSMLPHLSGDESLALRKYANQGESVESLLKAEGIAPEQTDSAIRFSYNHMESFMWEVLRGDFSGDGYEDLLISKYERTIEGTYSSFESLILSTSDSHSQFRVRELGKNEFVKLLS